MDLTVIEANKNIPIFNLFAASHSFTQNIFVPFTPDYMVVRAVNYSPAAADTPSSYLITSDITNEVIGSFAVYATSDTPFAGVAVNAQPLFFKLNKPVSGTYSFNITNSLQGDFNNLAGTLVIHLEFIKFKAEKPQRIM